MRNILLAALSQSDRGLLQPQLTSVTLKLRQELEKPNRHVEDVFFMDSGIASVVAVQDPEMSVEVGLIGCEGMSGSAVVLGTLYSPHSIYIQSPVADCTSERPNFVRRWMRASLCTGCC
jgi:hypothetical protein